MTCCIMTSPEDTYDLREHRPPLDSIGNSEMACTVNVVHCNDIRGEFEQVQFPRRCSGVHEAPRGHTLFAQVTMGILIL